jgi:hypothetical protein
MLKAVLPNHKSSKMVGTAGIGISRLRNQESSASVDGSQDNGLFGINY